MEYPKVYWQRRVYEAYSEIYYHASELEKLSDPIFEDYCILPQSGLPWLCLQTFGLRHSYPEFAIHDRISSRYHFYCILAGKGYANGQLVESGDAILFQRNNPFNISADPNDPFVFVWMTFKGDRADDYVSLLNPTTGCTIFKMDRLDKICALFYDILYVDHDECEVALYLEATMIKVLSMLKGQQKLPDKQDDIHQNKHIYLAINYLAKYCFRQDFHIREVSDAIGLNEKYLRKLFLQEVHISMRDYVTNARIKRAKELLRYSNYNVSEIAGFVGYRDLRQFYTLFKRKTGKAPSDYRGK